MRTTQGLALRPVDPANYRPSPKHPHDAQSLSPRIVGQIHRLRIPLIPQFGLQRAFQASIENHHHDVHLPKAPPTHDRKANLAS